MSAKDPSNRVLIIVALIGTTGTIAAALIGNWDNIVSPNSGSARHDQSSLGIGGSPVETPHEGTTGKATEFSGIWFVQSILKETSYRPYIGLTVRYKVIITQDGDKVIANGEKIGEVFRTKVREYSGSEKTPIRLTGFLDVDNLGKVHLTFNGQEDGVLRKSFATSFALEVVTPWKMLGTFLSTAADSKGECTWIREERWLRDGWTEPDKQSG